jgi:hypothetical protein
VAACLAAASVATSASSADAAVTIGQVADPDVNCDVAGLEFVQLGVTSGNSYVVPGNGTITSWTTQAGADAGELTMKIFRKLVDPATFQVVGHAGPQTLTPEGTAGNTFPANVRVRPGDLLGLHTVSPTFCGFKDPAGQHAIFSGDLADGAAAEFGLEGEFDLDIQAAFVPDNAISLGGTKRNKKKGTATLNLTLPNPGELSASGDGVKAASAGRAVISKSVSAGPASLLIKAKGKKKRTLNETGKVTLKPKIIYTPTGGDPSAQSVKVKLIKR